MAAQLKKADIEFEQVENAFLSIADIEKANELSAALDGELLHSKLNQVAEQYCPVVKELDVHYNWSIMQAEYATDLIFKNQTTLQSFYPFLLETLIQAVKPADIATFLGRKLHGNSQDEMGNRFNQRWVGSRIKHQMGPVSIKMYDKFNIILRIETTVNNVSFFKQYRQVLHAVHKRYLKFISAIDTPDAGLDNLHRLTETQHENDRRYKGFNLLSEEDSSLFRLLSQGQFVINGFSNKDLRQRLSGKNSGQITRLFKRLRVHGLIKRAGQSYRYYLTDLGRLVSTTALKLREMLVIPQLASRTA